MLNNKMKILLLSHQYSVTGAPFSLLRMAKLLKEMGFELTVISPEDGELRKMYLEQKIEALVEPGCFEDDKFVSFASTFDLIIANTANTYGMVEKMQNLVPTLWFVREGECIDEVCENIKTLKPVLKKARNIVCVSEYARDHMVKNYNNNVEVLHNSMEDLFEKFYPYSGGKINFIMIGYICPRKSVDVFVDAILALPPEYRDKASFHVVGGVFPEFAEFDRVLKEKSKNCPEIVWHGEIADQKEKVELFKKMDVFVTISRDESCSLVVLEASVMGKTSIISENVGAKYLIENNKNGFVVETGSDKKLVRVLKKIIDDPMQLNEMGRISRENFLKTSTIEIYKKNLNLMIIRCLLKDWRVVNNKLPISWYLHLIKFKKMLKKIMKKMLRSSTNLIFIKAYRKKARAWINHHIK